MTSATFQCDCAPSGCGGVSTHPATNRLNGSVAALIEYDAKWVIGVMKIATSWRNDGRKSGRHPRAGFGERVKKGKQNEKKYPVMKELVFLCSFSCTTRCFCVAWKDF